jgi:hypothetical protein
MKYIYVQAEAPAHDLTMISFAHIWINAKSQDDAYEIGRKHFKRWPTKQGKSGYRLMNDYVTTGK